MANSFDIPTDPPDDDAPEEEEEGQEEEEEEQDDDEPEPPAAAPTPPQSPPQRKSRKNHKGTTRAETSKFRVPTTPPVWREKDAELLWPEILSELGKIGGYYAGRSVHDVEIRVQRIAPPPSVTLTRFEGIAVAQDTEINPGDALINYLDEYVHHPSGGGQQVSYQLHFLWKAGAEAGKCLAKGTIVRPPSSSIYAMKTAAGRAAMKMGAGSAPPPTQPYGQPPSPPYMHPPQQPGYPAPQQTYAQQTSYGMPPFVGDMLAQLTAQQQQQFGALVDQLNQERSENARLRGQPPPAPVIVPASATPPEDLDARIAKTVAVTLKALGIGAAPAPAPVPTPPPAPPPQSPAAKLGEELLSSALSMLGEQMKERLADVIGGGPAQAVAEVATAAVGAVTGGAAPQAPLVKPADPKESLPFQEVPLHNRWPDGSQVVWPIAKDGEGVFGIHPMGAIMGNPYLTGRIMDAAGSQIGRVMGAVADIAQKVATAPNPPGAASSSQPAPAPPPPPPSQQQPAQAHVVSNIPEGAVDGTPQPQPQWPSHWPTGE